jgi:1-pyrroline-5-carboxylate dehydrogenase
MDVFREAGVPAGVINMVMGDAAMISDTLMASPDFSGVHFTGSTGVFQGIWKKIGDNIKNYKTYPRIVGETGGKDFIVAHSSSNPKQVATAMARGAFEYQGQKCSAASRCYIPKSIWEDVKNYLVDDIRSFKMGTPEDMGNFINAVTVIVTKDPKYTTMCTELFGPVLTVYVYDDKKWEETLHLVDETSEYALTGAVFSEDRYALEEAVKILENAAGNFYINDKPTGAVVGQQPFGGARASGTNDKAGSKQNLYRWISPRMVKETFVSPTDYRYPFLG